MTKVILNIEPLGCPSCARKVENLLKGEKAINQVTILPQLGKIRMDYDDKRLDLAHIKGILNQAGVPILSEGGVRT